MAKQLEELDDSMDVQLMMEFRQVYWDRWVKFCKEHGYKPRVHD